MADPESIAYQKLHLAFRCTLEPGSLGRTPAAVIIPHPNALYARVTCHGQVQGSDDFPRGSTALHLDLFAPFDIPPVNELFRFYTPLGDAVTIAPRKAQVQPAGAQVKLCNDYLAGDAFTGNRKELALLRLALGSEYKKIVPLSKVADEAWVVFSEHTGIQHTVHTWVEFYLEPTPP